MRGSLGVVVDVLLVLVLIALAVVVRQQSRTSGGHLDASRKEADDVLARAEQRAADLEKRAQERLDRAEAEAARMVEAAVRTASDEARASLAVLRQSAEADLTVTRGEVARREERVSVSEQRLGDREQRLAAELERSSRASAAAHQRDEQATATMAEAARLREVMQQEATRVRADLDAVRADLDAELADLEAERNVQEALLTAERDKAAAELAAERDSELQRLAALTREQARVELLAEVEQKSRREAAVIVRDLEAEARRTGEARARDIVVQAVQRVASESTQEHTVAVLHLPGEDFKGRIIGREGRNIRTFEQVTGVNVIIDDTPDAVLLSCFDPVRREIGRLTLAALVHDGRIHPHRIEEQYEQSRLEVDASIARAGEDALMAVGFTDVHPELVTLLGRLKYRTSYGQNVLGHLVETAHIAASMAAELRVDVASVKRAAFLHDIGKALTHEVEGSHAMIGGDLARRFGESAEVVHAIEAHHGEVRPSTVEAYLTIASDSCSGGRPGARRDSLEQYVQRLDRIEEIASSKPGVEKVFAMAAGREVRVMVQPDKIDDAEAQLLARDIARQIEAELTYPGQIRVTVVRESRATETAR